MESNQVEIAQDIYQTKTQWTVQTQIAEQIIKNFPELSPTSIIVISNAIMNKISQGINYSDDLEKVIQVLFSKAVQGLQNQKVQLPNSAKVVDPRRGRSYQPFARSPSLSRRPSLTRSQRRNPRARAPRSRSMTPERGRSRTPERRYTRAPRSRSMTPERGRSRTPERRYSRDTKGRSRTPERYSRPYAPRGGRGTYRGSYHGGSRGGNRGGYKK